MTPMYNDPWRTGEGLSPDERAVWEDKVRHALYGENQRVRADIDRKAAKENAPGPGERRVYLSSEEFLSSLDDPLSEHEALD